MNNPKLVALAAGVALAFGGGVALAANVDDNPSSDIGTTSGTVEDSGGTTVEAFSTSDDVGSTSGSVDDHGDDGPNHDVGDDHGRTSGHDDEDDHGGNSGPGGDDGDDDHGGNSGPGGGDDGSGEG